MRFWRRSFFPGVTFFFMIWYFQSSVQSRTVIANCSKWTHLLPLDGKLWRYRWRCENISHSRNTSCSERSVELLYNISCLWNFFRVNLQLLKLQLPLRWSYLHFNLNFRSSHHIHSLYVPLQGMNSWHGNTRWLPRYFSCSKLFAPFPQSEHLEQAIFLDTRLPLFQRCDTFLF